MEMDDGEMTRIIEGIEFGWIMCIVQEVQGGAQGVETRQETMDHLVHLQKKWEIQETIEGIATWIEEDGREDDEGEVIGEEIQEDIREVILEIDPTGMSKEIENRREKLGSILIRRQTKKTNRQS